MLALAKEGWSFLRLPHAKTMVMFKAHVVRRAALHEFEMLAAFYDDVRAIVNASIVKLEVTFEGVFRSLSIKVAIELLRVIVVLPVYLDLRL